MNIALNQLLRLLSDNATFLKPYSHILKSASCPLLAYRPICLSLPLSTKQLCSLSAVYFSPDHSLDSHSNIKFLPILVNTPFQDNFSYTQHHFHFKLLKIIALLLYFTSMSQFKNYRSPNHSALEILLLNLQASHLGLPISHPTSISKCWCIFQPIAFTTRLCLISKLENSMLSTSVVPSL